MKKIINGKKYDTTTATKICSMDVNSERRGGNYIYNNDFYFWQKTLFLKKTGEYFLHISGYFGDEIMPVDIDKSKQFASRADNFFGDYEAVFLKMERNKKS